IHRDQSRKRRSGRRVGFAKTQRSQPVEPNVKRGKPLFLPNVAAFPSGGYSCRVEKAGVVGGMDVGALLLVVCEGVETRRLLEPLLVEEALECYFTSPGAIELEARAASASLILLELGEREQPQIVQRIASLSAKGHAPILVLANDAADPRL